MYMYKYNPSRDLTNSYIKVCIHYHSFFLITFRLSSKLQGNTLKYKNYV